MNHVLPKEYNQTLAVLQDKAPYAPYEKVEKIFIEEFGRKPSDVFQTFEQTPIASASVAQVHIATLKDGTKVAVKVQKPEIQKHISIDLTTYKWLVWAFEKVFELPMYWTVETTINNLMKEVDFINEGHNAER
jgi:aarF domain-containing kinase